MHFDYICSVWISFTNHTQKIKRKKCKLWTANKAKCTRLLNWLMWLKIFNKCAMCAVSISNQIDFGYFLGFLVRFFVADVVVDRRSTFQWELSLWAYTKHITELKFYQKLLHFLKSPVKICICFFPLHYVCVFFYSVRCVSIIFWIQSSNIEIQITLSNSFYRVIGGTI